MLQLLGCNCFAQNNYSIVIDWVDKVEGDFSFTNKWSYPEGVYLNEFNQLSCDGLCPLEVDDMKDGRGRIFLDSLKSFYTLVDTTHRVHTINCQAHCWEWAGTDFIECRKQKGDTIDCFTLCNASTHSSLVLQIATPNCLPQIELTGIISGGDLISKCTGGFIKIDKGLWERSVMKAIFNFEFEGTDNEKKPFYWEGSIYAKVQ